MNSRPHFVWDYDISNSEFQAILSGELTIGRLGQDWAVVRLLEYGTYREIIQMLGYRRLIEGWPRWRDKIRSDSRKRGYDFLSEWIPEHRPDLLTES
ncbi:MAG: hypothetical protein ACK2U1_05955 [Anaerolineales bacterium]